MKQYLNMDEFNLKMDRGGPMGKMDILDKDGSLETANGYGAISLEASQYRLAKLPYFSGIRNVREVIYCTEGLSDRKTYAIWNNALYAPGYGETPIGNDRRHLSVSELEQIDQYPGPSLWSFQKNKMPTSHEVKITLANPRIMVELLPKAFSLVSSNSEAPINEGPSSKRQKRDQKTIDPPSENATTKLHKRKYIIGGKWVDKSPTRLTIMAQLVRRIPTQTLTGLRNRAIRRHRKRKGDGQKPPKELGGKRQERPRRQNGSVGS